MELDMQSKAASCALVNHEGRPLETSARQVQAPNITPLDMINSAVQRGASFEQINQLITLKERIEADDARKAFADDMVRFKAKPLEIKKDKQVGYTTKEGEFVGYMHATIGNVVEVVVPALAEFGFSHRWDTEQRDGLVIVTCVITHRLGHSQSTTLMASPDQSGKKNPIQSIISAKTYLERHTLLAATGLATKDMQDDDGEDAGLNRNAVRDAVSEKRAKEQAGPSEELLAAARAAADAGTKEFTVFWKSAQPAQRGSLRNEVRDLEQRCAAADKKAGASPAGRQ